MIDEKRRFIFIHIPKTAGTSIEKSFGHFDALERGSQDHRTIREIKALKFLELPGLVSQNGLFEGARELRSLLRYPNRVDHSTFSSYYKFAFVRNPWARVYSWYKNVMRDELHRKSRNIEKDCSLYRFLTEYGWQTELRSQLTWLKGRSGEIEVDFIGRFEYLQQDIDIVTSDMNIDRIQIPHMLKGEVDDYRLKYDNKTRELVARVYAEEIEFFSYSFD